MTDEIATPVSALLGKFSESMTELVNEAFGGSWADNDEFIVLSELILSDAPTPRGLAASAAIARHVLDHLLERLRRDGLISTSASPTDGRAIIIGLTPAGQERADRLRASLDSLLTESRSLASAVLTGLGASCPDVESSGARTHAVAVLGRTGRVGKSLVAGINDLNLPVISGRQRAALVQIAATTGVRPVDIGQAQSTSRQSAAYVIDQLTGAGLIVRRRGRVPTDGRAVTLEVTDRGRALVDGVDGVIRRHRDELVALFWEIAARPRTTSDGTSIDRGLWQKVAVGLRPIQGEPRLDGQIEPKHDQPLEVKGPLG